MKTPREILKKEIPCFHSMRPQDKCVKCEAKINQLLKDLDTLIPKKKTCTIKCQDSHIGCICGTDDYNQAIDEMHKIFKK